MITVDAVVPKNGMPIKMEGRRFNLGEVEMLARIGRINRGETTQGLGNPGENADSYFHPLLGSFSPAQTGQATEIQGKSSLSTKKWQSHLANPGLDKNFDQITADDIAELYKQGIYEVNFSNSNAIFLVSVVGLILG